MRIASFLIVAALLIGESPVAAQTSSLRPSIGLTVNAFGKYLPVGYGIDLSAKTSAIYFGFQMGFDGYEGETVSAPRGTERQPVYEHYFGAHAGYNSDSTYSLGVSLLLGLRHEDDGTISKWIDPGIDWRIQSAKHLMWLFGWNWRRGPKLGIAFTLQGRV